MSNGNPAVPRRLYAEWLAVAIVASLLVATLVWARVTVRLDNILYDRALEADRRTPPDDILIVAIDSASLRQIGAWPWPRSVHAQLLDRLAAAKPKAVGYDVLFVEPTEQDAALASAMRRVPTYLPLLVDVPGTNGAPFDAIDPAGDLKAAAAGIAHVNVGFDGDRVIRQVNLEEGGGGQSWIQLAAAMAGTKPDPAIDTKRPGLWQERPVLIPYGGGAGHFQTVSFTDVLSGNIPAEFLHGRYILVGATANGMGDSYPTPSTGDTSQMSGVEIQAHLLDALLHGHVITPASPIVQLAVALAALWIMLLGFLRLGPSATGYLLLGLLIAILGGSLALLHWGRLWVPPGATLMGLLFVYPLWGWRRLHTLSLYMTEELRVLEHERDDLPQAAAVASREVTTQAALLRGAIDRLRDLRRFLADAITHLPDALFVTDLEGRISLSNDEARTLAERLGLDGGRGAAVGPLLETLGAAPIDADGPSEGGIDLRDDQERSYELRWVAQHDAADRRIGWIVRIADTTRLKQAERGREEALELLSHDMRAPQSAILTMITQEGAGMPTDLAARIARQARRTLDLAENFVQLARAEAKPIDEDEVDLADVLIDSADALWTQSRARGVVVDLETPDEPPLLPGDRQLLTRAVTNLLSNAIKYSDEGGRVSCVLTHCTEKARLVITDKGVGMTEAEQGRLFQRFARGRREGVGLGLALVDTVVRRHGGTIACETAPGEGTRFTIDLPLANAA
ncbi:CHASE2 and HATPase_c domain-containing protein [Sphingomonas montanisoli]|uniref:CHASE2 and HATPase_c domain-containing protein n=1 Tax=Sphingomonas montanisoli TaxID=2606412 RepID=UPI001FECEFA2|nr:CHASE2 and HATPase_c domain-containing protein [Sphingomonas montanisoli]